MVDTRYRSPRYRRRDDKIGARIDRGHLSTVFVYRAFYYATERILDRFNNVYDESHGSDRYDMKSRTTDAFSRVHRLRWRCRPYDLRPDFLDCLGIFVVNRHGRCIPRTSTDVSEIERKNNTIFVFLIKSRRCRRFSRREFYTHRRRPETHTHTGSRCT